MAGYQLMGLAFAHANAPVRGKFGNQTILALLEMNWHIITRLISRIKVILVQVSFPIKSRQGSEVALHFFFSSGFLFFCQERGNDGEAATETSG